MTSWQGDLDAYLPLQGVPADHVARLLLAQVGNDAWLWHERLGHQHFGALQKMAHIGMVRGLTEIGQVDQLCDACLAGKQCRASFPLVAKF